MNHLTHTGLDKALIAPTVLGSLCNPCYSLLHRVPVHCQRTLRVSPEHDCKIYTPGPWVFVRGYSMAGCWAKAHGAWDCLPESHVHLEHSEEESEPVNASWLQTHVRFP